MYNGYYAVGEKQFSVARVSCTQDYRKGRVKYVRRKIFIFKQVRRVAKIYGIGGTVDIRGAALRRVALSQNETY